MTATPEELDRIAEPVAWRIKLSNGDYAVFDYKPYHCPESLLEPLYTRSAIDKALALAAADLIESLQKQQTQKKQQDEG